MTRQQINAALEPHARARIKRFLSRPSAAEGAFWEAVYAGRQSITHEEALALAAKLEQSEQRVGRVLEGWLP